uniref:Serine/threonine protein kinase n=1 Tax=Solibacter usitatus (strain Ellin6076) TaxID=234267 RepID=Q01YB1_SOLUE
MAKCSTCGSEVAGHFCASCGASNGVEAFATQTISSSSSAPRRATNSRTQGRFAPGELLGGRYRIVAMLGKGGMGEVYRADDLSLDQPVALKFLPEAFTHHEQTLERFRGEVRIARQVSHPNVCRVYDLGQMEGLYFLSMEYVDGEDLGSLLRRIGRIPTDKALEIARKLCAGLAAAHEKGVLHRDLKPANVMLDGRGEVLLTDFGLAGLAGEIEGAEVRNGTPAYMAPEQHTGEEVTIKSDIYALGLVLYEIFTGKLPFESATLAGLMRAQRESVPVSLSSIVHDLDPTVEKIILRCLNPKPAMRPASALSVAAALPGGDPLAAALAAGETPSPEMVAAAGEGEGLSIKIAIPLLLTVLVGVPLGIAMRGSALATLAPDLGPEVLAQKSREIAARFGAEARPFDEAYKYEWDNGLFEWFSNRPGGHANWGQVLAANPQALRFQYRSHTAPLTGMMFHDDLLTPGMVQWDDPPPEESGMVRMQLDSRGQLVYFERVPAQQQKPGNAAATDWGTLFAAAGLDQGKFQTAEPLWTSLATSDTRAAWTRSSPREQRVEAASLRGQPVFFSVIEPWTKPDRVPGSSDSTATQVVLGALAALLVVLMVAAALLAAGNLRRQRGDRRGALRLGMFVIIVQMALWVTRAHLLISIGTFGTFLVALATALFYGVVMWMMYMALEPHVRRRWPQALISWSAVLIGRVRDAVVGRDVLIGCAAGAVIDVINGFSQTWLRQQGGWPDLSYTYTLGGARGAIAVIMIGIPHAIRSALFFFFLIFLLRALLRNQWAAGVAFAVLLASLSLADTSHPLFNTAIDFVVLLGMAIVMLRWGLLAFCSLLLFTILSTAPGARTTAWFFGESAFLVALSLVLAGWAFHTSLGGRKLWKEDFFG